MSAVVASVSVASVGLAYACYRWMREMPDTVAARCRADDEASVEGRSAPEPPEAHD